MKTLQHLLGGFLGTLLIFLIWQWGNWVWGSSLVPDPLSTLQLAVQTLARGDFWVDALTTVLRSLLGFGLALGLGLTLGLISRGFGTQTLQPLISVIQATPALLWTVPLVLILGTGDGAPVAVSFLVALPLLYYTTRDSLKLLTPQLSDIMRLYAPRAGLWFSEVVRPILNATLRPALTVGIALSLKSALIGEWFGSRTGLGRSIQTAWAVYHIERFYALTFLFLLIVLLLVAIGHLAAKWFFPNRIVTPHSPLSGTCAEEIPSSSAERGGFQFEKVSFRYGSKKVFEHWTLKLAPGASLLVSGPSGCGKTTLARLAAGLLSPQSGTIHRQGRVAVVFQEDSLLPHRDALGNTALPLWASGRLDWKEAAARCLDWVGLCDYNQFPDEMSGGMRKRLTLARALAAEPDTLILDEPLVNLHDEARTELWDLIFELHRRQRFALLVISHYPQEVESRVQNWLRLGDKQDLPNKASGRVVPYLH